MTDRPPAPLYRQIADLLVRRIASGELIEGERLPPERDLAAAQGVAVGTLRKALEALHAQGLLERRQGSGNYVRGVRAVGGLYGFFRLETATGQGLPDAEILSFDTRPKPAHAPPFGTDPRAHRIRRLRRLDRSPVAVEEIWLDAARAPTLAPSDLSPTLYRDYSARFGLRIVHVEDRVGVAELPDWGAAPLAAAAGTTLGHVARLAGAQDGAAVEYSETWFLSDRVRYVSRLK